MDLNRRLLLLCCLLSVSCVTRGDASLSSAANYWKSTFPNTPIPKQLDDILSSGLESKKDAKNPSVIGRDGLNLGPVGEAQGKSDGFIKYKAAKGHNDGFIKYNAKGKDDGFIKYSAKSGQDDGFIKYNAKGGQDDGFIKYNAEGKDNGFIKYNAESKDDGGFIKYNVKSGQDDGFIKYNAKAGQDDGFIRYNAEGKDDGFIKYNTKSGQDDGFIKYNAEGKDDGFIKYNTEGKDDGFIKYNAKAGQDDGFIKYNVKAAQDDGFIKYNSKVNQDDGFIKYNSKVGQDDGFIKYNVNSAKDDGFIKYSAKSNQDDGFVKYNGKGQDEGFIKYNAKSQDDGFIKYKAHKAELAKASRPEQNPEKFFFLEKDLQKSNKMRLSFPRVTNKATMLPRKSTDSLPFSTDKLPEIFKRFGVRPNSIEANKMINTLSICSQTGLKVEKKTCATSLEAMVDFVKSQIGTDVNVMMTVVHGQNHLQSYTIDTGAVKMLTNEDKQRVVTCHKKNYVYAVYYCHRLENTVAYKVPLVGEDGTKVDAMAVCHLETSHMGPDWWAFRVLGLKPGSPVCHFLPQDHVVFYG